MTKNDIALADYVKSRMGERSIRSVAEEAGISHTALAKLLKGGTVPRAETLQALAAAIDADEARLLSLAGYLADIPHGALDPRAAHVAQLLTNLSPEERGIALDAVEAQVRAFYSLVDLERQVRRIAPHVAAEIDAELDAEDLAEGADEGG